MASILAKQSRTFSVILRYCWIRSVLKGSLAYKRVLKFNRTEQTTHMRFLTEISHLNFRKHVLTIWSVFTTSEIFLYRDVQGCLQLELTSTESCFGSSHSPPPSPPGSSRALLVPRGRGHHLQVSSACIQVPHCFALLSMAKVMLMCMMRFSRMADLKF